MSNQYQQYTVISRDEGGMIVRQSNVLSMAKRGIKGAPGATEHAAVVSVEDGQVAGWSGATAIGLVQQYVDDKPVDSPLLALLY